MIARDEADVIEAVVRHTLAHVDEVIAVDHRSQDGTREILSGLPVVLQAMEERGLWGDKVWTRLAGEAFERGHEWLLVTDADDVWHPTKQPGQRVADYLALMSASTLAVRGGSFNHVPTAADDSAEANPLLRIGWRRRAPDAYKVACRLRSDLTYAEHGAWYGGERCTPKDQGLTVRHFTIRTADQLVRKVRNGTDAASVEAGLPVGYDEGWEQWEGATDAQIRARFRADFWSADPKADASLVYDPAPVMRA